MVVSTRSRSMSQKADTTKFVTRAKVPTKTRAKVTNAKSVSTLQQLDDFFAKHRPVNFRIVLAKTSSRDKNLEVDESTYLAMGVFIDSLKKERQKNDPDFVPTPQFYRAAMRDFNSLNDDSKAMHITEAKKRNSIDNDVAKSKVAMKYLKVTSPSRFNDGIEDEAGLLYVIAKKNDPDFNFAGEYGAQDASSFFHLSDDERAPYCAEAVLRIVDGRAKMAKALAKYGHPPCYFVGRNFVTE